MSTASELALLITARDTASPHLRGVRQEVVSLGDAAGAIAGGLAKLGLGMAAAGTAAVGLGGIAVKAASDLSESQNKVSVVFGDSADKVKQFAETAAGSLGQSKQQALEAAGTFGNLFVSMGLGQQASADLSVNIVKLGSDLASFNNINPTEALEKLRAGLVGETEPLRTLGVNLNAAAVEAKAMQMGLADASGEISEAAKIQARYALILDQTRTAQGDFARTSDGLANSTRIIEASFKDLQATIGEELLPVVAPLVAKFAKELPEAIQGMKPGLESFGDDFVDAMDRSDKAMRLQVIPAVQTLREELDKLGKAMMTIPDLLGRIGETMGRTPLWQALGWVGERVGDLAESQKQIKGSLIGGILNEADAAALSYQQKVQAAQDEYFAAQAGKPALRYMPDRMSDIATAKARPSLPPIAPLPSSKGGGSKGWDEKRALKETNDLLNQMQQEADDAAFAMMRAGEKSGQAWIEAWFETDKAIQNAQASAERAIREMEQNDILEKTIRSRRAAFEEGLSGEELQRSRRRQDEAELWMYQRQLSKADNEERRRQIREQFEDAREVLDYRRTREDEDREWAKGQAQKRQDFEDELNREAMDRQRARILEQRDEAIAAINAQWERKQQQIEEEKNAEIKAAREAAEGKAVALKNEFFDTLTENAVPGIDRYIAMVNEKLGSVLGQVGGSGGGGGSDPNAGRWEGGTYVDPSHQPGGADFEQWRANEPEQYAAWAAEHGMADGGIVTRPTLALIGERGPEAVVPLGRGGAVGNITVDLRGATVYGVDDMENLVVAAVTKAQRRGRLN